MSDLEGKGDNTESEKGQSPMTLKVSNLDKLVAGRECD